MDPGKYDKSSNLMADALLTRMSMPPKVLTAASMQAWT